MSSGYHIEDLANAGYEEEDEADWDRAEREENMGECGCQLCMCMVRTENGEICYDCANHAHQG